MKADLLLSCGKSLYIADHLYLELSLFEGGIMRLVIDEKDVSPERFRVSDHDMGAVIQEIIPVHDLKEIS